jgi:hypothetical protein
MFFRLDDAVGVFVNLGHDISHFGDEVASVFNVSKAAVIGSAVLQGACSVEHAIAASLNHDLDEIKAFGSGIVGFATELGNLANKGLDELEKDVQQVGHEIEQKAEEVGQEIKQGAEHVGAEIKQGAEEAGHKIEQVADEVGHDIKQGAEEFGSAIAHGAESVVNVVKKTCVIM